MRLRVQYTAHMRSALGRAEDEVELPEGSSLGDLLDHLTTSVGRDAAPFLLTPDGRWQPSLLVAVNSGAVLAQEARSVPIRSGDVVTLLLPIAGG